MNEEQVERAVLSYLTADELENFRSLTTIFEQFSRSPEWESSFFDDINDVDDKKEAVRAVLDQMVLDGLLVSRMGERDYESFYRATRQGAYEASFEDSPLVAGPADPLEDPEPRVDSTFWTGLSRTVIDVRNASAVSGLIDKALASLAGSHAGNVENMQAAAYLRAAKALLEAPEPPSELIWQLIGRAADLVGLLAVFYTIFSQAAR